ncbi:MAG: STAS domain-containing protein [Candidatus Hydrogenedentota bacterium]
MKKYVKIDTPENFDMTYIFDLKSKMSNFPYEQKYSIIFDFKKTKFLSSLGVGVLLYLNARTKKNNGEMRLINVNETIMNTFHLLGADQEVTISESEEIPAGWEEVIF